MTGAQVYPEDHPQGRGDIRRDRSDRVRWALVTLLRLIPQTGYSRAPVVAEALGRTERGCIRRITRSGLRTSVGPVSFTCVHLRVRCCD